MEFLDYSEEQISFPSDIDVGSNQMSELMFAEMDNDGTFESILQEIYIDNDDQLDTWMAASDADSDCLGEVWEIQPDLDNEINTDSFDADMDNDGTFESVLQGIDTDNDNDGKLDTLMAASDTEGDDIVEVWEIQLDLEIDVNIDSFDAPIDTMLETLMNIAIPVKSVDANQQKNDEKLGKTEQLIKDIRKTPIFCQLIPQESGIGWPIPVRKDGKVFITLPFFGMIATAQKGETALSPFFATITLNWANLIPVEYVNLQYRQPSEELSWEGKQVGTFPHGAVAQMSVDKYKQTRSQLLSMYDELFEILSGNSAFSSEWSDRFGNLLRTLMEPSLKPYYRALAPKFFERFLTSN